MRRCRIAWSRSARAAVCSACRRSARTAGRAARGRSFRVPTPLAPPPRLSSLPPLMTSRPAAALASFRLELAASDRTRQSSPAVDLTRLERSRISIERLGARRARRAAGDDRSSPRPRCGGKEGETSARRDAQHYEARRRGGAPSFPTDGTPGAPPRPHRARRGPDVKGSARARARAATDGRRRRARAGGEEGRPQGSRACAAAQFLVRANGKSRCRRRRVGG